MICKPYKSATKTNISQGFGVNPCSYQPNGHTGVDFCSSYGTPLVAPELCIVSNIIEAKKISSDESDLEKGFGIMLASKINPGVFYLYWHCLPVFPVNLGDTVTQGQPVAFMGNSGFVMSGGKTVAVDIRTIPPYLGTHLHAERFTEENGKRIYTDITKYIDWNIPVNYDLITTIKFILTKISNLIK